MARTPTTPEQGTRAKRVGEGIREEIAALLASDVKDPRAAGAVVTRVELTDDLRNARVYVRLLTTEDDEDRRRDLVNALRRAAGMLRREVTQRLRLRFAPELRFFYDDGQDATTRIEEILNEIHSGRKPGG
jgi:ribosome-binding factor A